MLQKPNEADILKRVIQYGTATGQLDDNEKMAILDEIKDIEKQYAAVPVLVLLSIYQHPHPLREKINSIKKELHVF